MANYRYATPEYMRRNNAVPRPAVCPSDHFTPAPYTPHVLAMAYVPWQEWTSIYESEKGLHCGTIFQELHKPFHRSGGCS